MVIPLSLKNQVKYIVPTYDIIIDLSRIFQRVYPFIMINNIYLDTLKCNLSKNKILVFPLQNPNVVSVTRSFR